MLINACCCEPSCLLFKDDFDRADNTNVGGGWQEVSGDAQISTNRLRTAVLGAGTTIATFVHTSETMVVDVAMLFDSGSIAVERAGVIVNYKDSSNYLFVQIEATFSAFAGTVRTRLQFFSRVGGTNTQLGTTRTIDASNGIASHQLRVCYDGTYLSALGNREAATKITDGFRAGVYSNSTSAVFFNNFRLYKHDIQCPNCIPQPQCGYCFDATEPTGTVILDFGAATLTDSGWNSCDQIKGEYVLILDDTFPLVCGQTVLPKCFWLYSTTLGTYTDIWCTGRVVSLCLAAAVTSDLSGQSQWVVTVRATVDAGCRFGPAILSANYRGNHTVSGVCNETPITLNKDFQFVNATPSCTGTLPATIELRLG